MAASIFETDGPTGPPSGTSIRQTLRKEADERLNGKPVLPPLKRPKHERVSYVTTDLAQNILQRADFDRNFELLVLNLNGYENHALEGLDFDVYKPRFILAKVGIRTLTLSNMPSSYKMIASSKHDERSMLRLFRYSDFGSN